MTENLDYSYRNIDLPFNSEKIENLIKAVRVKLGLNEKLKRNYKPKTSEEKTQPVEETAKKSPITDTIESVDVLTSKLDRLMDLGKVQHVTKRVVLFTNEFEQKYKDFFLKLFPIKSKEDVGVNNMSIPNTWENVEPNELENNLLNQNNEEISNMVSTEEASPIEPANEEVPVTLEETPSIEGTSEVTKETTTTELPVEEPKTIVPPTENSFDFALPSFDMEPKVEEQSSSAEINMPSFDMDSNIEVPAQDAMVPEPVEIPNSFDTIKPVSDSSESEVSIEDKIAALLNKGKSTEEVSNETPEMPTMDTDKKDPSQADVIARVQKAKNALKDKDAEIASLKDKVGDITDKYNTTKAKLEGYNAVIRDVTNKYDETVRSNEELSTKYAQLEESSSARIATLEEQLKESQQARILESEKSKQAISDLKNAHSKEIEDITRNNRAELTRMKEEKDRQLKEVYSGILNVLSPSEESYKKVA